MSNVDDQKNNKKVKYVVLNKTQSYALDMYLRDMTKRFDNMCSRDIAKQCCEALGFEISPSTIAGTRKAMVAAGVEVWEEPEKKRGSTKARIESLEKQLAESDEKFKVIFAKLHSISSFLEEGTSFLPTFEEKGGNGAALSL